MKNKNNLDCVKCNKYPAEIGDWCWICYLKNGQELNQFLGKNEKTKN